METNKRIPVTVVTGFLGAGKTTLVNHILRAEHGRRIAVVENEFGEVGIDEDLVAKSVSSDEQILQLDNGCLCCSVRGDLIKTLEKLIRRKNRFDHIVIECTGLANPGPVCQTFYLDDDIKESCRLDSVLAVVDCFHCTRHLDRHAISGEVNECVQQIAFSDKLLLNKTDMVEEDELDTLLKRLKRINAIAEIIPCQHSAVPMDKIFDLDAFSVQRVLQQMPDFLPQEESLAGEDHASCGHNHSDCGHDHDHVAGLEHGKHHHLEAVSSVGIMAEGSLSVKLFNKWLGTMLKERGEDLYRSKGVLCIHGSDEKFIFQGVHMKVTMSRSSELGLEPWQPGEKRTNKLVFIGRNLERKSLEEGFLGCLA
uniref:CobW C-terminal domain-containing protein n=1 Tax=Picocystis salinarum TaxID=88271 RepID=A0A7S3UFP5_9CHLO